MYSHALVLAGLVAQLVQAYTVVNMNKPIFYKNVDPIVFPGSYSKSHLHTFFGSDGITAKTTTSAELQSGCTNVQNPNDLSTYWVPTLLYTNNGGASHEPVPLSRFSAYYNLGEAPAEVPIPQNLKMLAGDAANQDVGRLNRDAKISWFCEGQNIPMGANGFPASTCATHLQTVIFFPQCVNEQTLEYAYKSRDHGTPNWCPRGMKSMPQLRFSIRYDLRRALPGGWDGEAPVKLACGNAHCHHADFINGWTPESAQNMVATTRDKREFFSVNGRLGANGVTPDCRPADREPTLGTSDYAESVQLMSKRSIETVGWESRSRMSKTV